jgi:hypothetical protein
MLTLRQGVPMEVIAGRVWAKIVYIEGIPNTIADTISQLEYDPSVNQTAKIYFTMKVES